jgi:stearoyl-CoA desaturase (delta-9 desaturase)
MRIVRGTAIALLHVPPLTLPWVATTAAHWAAFAVAYVLILFALGGGLHRYFAHRAFRTSRPFQLVLGLLAAACFGNPIGFAGRHRLHHRWSDTERDFHGPRRGLWFSWVGHLLEDGYAEHELLAVTGDLARYPELMWLHRWSFVPGVAAAGLVGLAGGWAMFAAAYCLPWCLVAIHGASAVNYVCHRHGRRRYATGDGSTNHPVLGVVLLGEGWHNNHHHYPTAARSGFFWWEVDGLYWLLRGLAGLGLVWDLGEVPAHVRTRGLVRDGGPLGPVGRP